MLLFAALCTSTFGKIIYVDYDATGANDGSSWENAYVYLQDALAAATGGDEIRVAQGIYKPDLGGGNTSGDRRATFQLINGVTLKGGFAGVDELDTDVRDFEAYETILSGDLNGDDVTVANPKDLKDELTLADNSIHVITGYSINETTVLDGLVIASGNANGPVDKGGGMYNSNSSPTLTNCIFRGNSSRYGAGGMANSDSSPILTDCTISGNAGSGMYNSNSSPSLTDCTFSRNAGSGMYNSNSSPSLTDCTFIENDSSGMHNSNSSPILTNCTFIENDSSGMYNSDSSPTLSNCTFSENSAESGGGMENSAESSPTLINCSFNSNSAGEGGGMCNKNDSSPTLTKCTFKENSAIEGGGMNNWENSNPILTNCTFYDNSSSWGSGMNNWGSSNPILADCSFSGNSATSWGGGMSNWGSSYPTMTNCTFNGNSADIGGGVYSLGDIGDNSSTILNNCTFSGNSGNTFGGGMYNSNGNPILTKCTFSGNSSNSGGGMYSSDIWEKSSTTLNNCTFSRNSATAWGGGICSFGNNSLTNCIMWYNTPEQTTQDQATITYSNIQGGFPGEGNIDVDPLFANPGYWADVNDPNIIVEPNDPNAVWVDGDYHLKSEAGRWDPVSESWIEDDVTSPCIDAGDPNSPVSDEPEPNGSRINMGAYGGTTEASMSPVGIKQIVYIQWLGHASVKIWTDDCIVYVDPQRLNITPHDATLVCVTHAHSDHYSPLDIAKVSNAQTQFIAPPDVVSQFGIGQTIAPGQTIEFDFVSIKAVPSYNTNKPNHPKSNNWVGYIIELADKRVYVAGDTDLIDEMKSLGDINVAFLPAGGTYTMNATEAAEATGYIKPDLAIPYHWGQNTGTVADAQRFVELARCPAMVMAVGETISSDNWPEYSPLIAHWALDETEGEVAHNSVSEGPIALFGEPAWQPDGGKIDGALQFDGINDYGITDFVLDPANGSFSVFAWIKGGAAGQTVISQADGIGSGETWLGTDPLLGKLMTGLVPPAAGRFIPQPLVSESIVIDGQWHHIGFVWDGSYRSLYVDGAEVAKDAAAQNSLKSADGGLYIGAGKNLDEATFFSGLIDDIRIYNEALDAEQIQEFAY